MILVDSNIPMYLVGPTHPHKDGARRLTEGLLAAGQRLVTDAEVLQEILHRYMAVNRRATIQPAFDIALALVEEVLPVDRNAVEHAKQIALGYGNVSARDAIHLAIMHQHGINQILSFDAGFDAFPGITRIC